MNASSLIAATCITAGTTVASAWRWRLIAGALGLRMSLGEAVASYYRSQFLNNVLPGGVLGDLHRGVRHGARTLDVARGVRSVVWDRVAGQAAQLIFAAVVLLGLASPVRTTTAVIVGFALIGAGLLAAMLLAVPTGSASGSARLARTLRHDVRAGLRTSRIGPAVFVASALVVVGHVGVFFVAATANGTPVSIPTLLPLAMLVLLAMALPFNVGGWGPREGVAAWAFAVAGLGAAQGAATATTYGVLSLVATCPGALVLLLSRESRPFASPPVASVGRPGVLMTAGSARVTDG